MLTVCLLHPSILLPSTLFLNSFLLPSCSFHLPLQPSFNPTIHSTSPLLAGEKVRDPIIIKKPHSELQIVPHTTVLSLLSSIPTSSLSILTSSCFFNFLLSFKPLLFLSHLLHPLFLPLASPFILLSFFPSITQRDFFFLFLSFSLICTS